MDREQQIVVNFIKTHMPDSCSDVKKLKAYLSDCIPDQKAKRKIMCDAFEEGVPEIIKSANDSGLAMHKCFKLLVDNCAMDEKAAAWAVETWACIYGHETWKVADSDIYGEASTPLSQPVNIPNTPAKPVAPQPTPQVIPSYGSNGFRPSSLSGGTIGFTGMGSGIGDSSYYEYEDDDEEDVQKDNYLSIDDQITLEDAGLDVDELANMDWTDRYDAIEEAGLDASDFDYGFED